METKPLLLKLLLLIVFFTSYESKAQISHGGKPLPYLNLTTRSISQNIFQEMPSFDVEAELRLDSLTRTDLRDGFRFAYKFMTDFTPDNSGNTFILADGTRVWRLGIRSSDAYSINILFSEYELPEGAKLFLYTPDQSQILGAFNHLNNSELGLLPVAPVHGDEVIIEYQEPAGVDFSGRLRISEVNHAYRDLRGDEPLEDRIAFSCMPSPVCFNDTADSYKEIQRSVVLLIINGDVLCTGALVNNTRKDGTPYLLTASHCLNKQFTEVNPDYVKTAGTIVSFFNYDSPFCTPTLRGTEEQSMASTRFRAVNEKSDMALLELLEIPPVYYQPYYAGWNATGNNAGPYTNIHHPWGSVKRIGICTRDIKLTSYSSGYGFNPDSFWNIPEWQTGSTAGGSSGSPLFDSNNRIIGALTGGKSSCSLPYDDVFYALHKSWMLGNEDSSSLKPWLDPSGSGNLYCDGLDPYEPNKAIELSNVQESGNRELSEVAYLSSPNTGQQFGVNSLKTTEYAESYTINGKAIVFGAYFVTPAIQNSTGLTVEIKVYSSSDNKTPTDSLYATGFTPTYTNKRIIDNTFQETNKPLNRAQESFIKFEKPVEVNNRFFISYKITASEKDSFTVYSLPADATTKNTAWIKHQNKWIENSAHPKKPFKSSLFINPVIQYQSAQTNNEVVQVSDIHITTDRSTKKITIKLPNNKINARYELFSIDGKALQTGILTNELNYIHLHQSGVFVLRLFHAEEKRVLKIVL